jgi:hypothetical protein
METNAHKQSRGMHDKHDWHVGVAVTEGRRLLHDDAATRRHSCMARTSAGGAARGGGGLAVVGGAVGGVAGAAVGGGPRALGGGRAPGGDATCTRHHPHTRT